jgi:ABC-type spermidine/putrescine transport system permease subunit I
MATALSSRLRFLGNTTDGGWAVTAFTTVWLLGIILPLCGLVVFSFLQSERMRFLWQPTLQAYLELLFTFRFEIVLRSLRITATMTVFLLLIAFPFALWLAKSVRSKWLKIITLVLLVVPFFLSPAARTIVWRSVLGRQGLINSALLNTGLIEDPIDWLLFSEFAVHFGYLSSYFPAMVWPLFISMSLIDDELIEASRDLGASPLDTLRWVILPLATPGIAAGLIFTFVPMLGDDVVPQLLGGGQVMLLSATVLNLFQVMNYTAAAAISTLLLLIIVLFYLLFLLALHHIGGMREVFAELRR